MLQQFFNELSEKMKQTPELTKDDDGRISLDYLKSVYDSIDSKLSSSMIIKDESVEMDLITFRCLFCCFLNEK